MVKFPRFLFKNICSLLKIENISDPMMNSSERISKLQSNLEELRKTYMTLRSKLTSIERRRKKIRKKEREKTDNPSGPEVEAAA